MTPTILVTNDDGITSSGIRTLIDEVRHLGKVTVVAPDSPQSAKGHAITINQPLRLVKVGIFEDWGIDAYACSGTPVDCVKLAVDKVFHKKPDLCVSGINHGSNAAINVIYSGTVSAAMEAAIERIPSIAFSLLNYSANANMEPCRKYVREIVNSVLQNGDGRNTLLNVNIPALPPEQIKGIKVCHQANAFWNEEFYEREDPVGRKYYWLTGEFVNDKMDHEGDQTALEEAYVSVVPLQFDLTAYKEMAYVRDILKK